MDTRYRLVVLTRKWIRERIDPYERRWETVKTQHFSLPKAINPQSAKIYATKHIQNDVEYPKDCEILNDLKFWKNWKSDKYKIAGDRIAYRKTGPYNGYHIIAEILEVTE